MLDASRLFSPHRPVFRRDRGSISQRKADGRSCVFVKDRPLGFRSC